MVRTVHYTRIRRYHEAVPLSPGTAAIFDNFSAVGDVPPLRPGR